MKPVTWVRFFLLCIVIGRFRAVEIRSVHSTPQEKIDALIDPSLIRGAEHTLRFDKTMLNIGTLTGDDVLEMHHFTCTNVSGKAANFIRVGTTRRCAVADVRTGEIPPGETRVVVLTYHPKSRPGTIDANAFIYLSSLDKMPMTRLALIGNVLSGAGEWGHYPYKMSKLKLKQNRIESWEVNAGKRPSKRVLCSNSGNQSLHLSAAVIPEPTTSRTEPEAISPGSEADVVIATDTSLTPAEKGRLFTFPTIIEGAEGQPSNRTLNIKVNCAK